MVQWADKVTCRGGSSLLQVDLAACFLAIAGSSFSPVTAGRAESNFAQSNEKGEPLRFAL
jgi:hypothetical protein